MDSRVNRIDSSRHPRTTSDAAAAAVISRIAPTGLMTTEQAAEYLGNKPATLATWRATGRVKLTFVRIGGQVRYRRQDLDAFIEANLCNA